MNNDAELRDRFLGCLLGCAVGDALGAPYEGLWSHSIPQDETLLSAFAEYEGYPAGQFTDDTQLSLATLQAIIRCGDVSPFETARSIAQLWRTQSVIGPGGACTQAAWRFLKSEDWTTCGAPVGQAGNGTAMRTAVVGLFFVHTSDQLPVKVAAVSQITHQDPRSIAGGVAIAKAAQLLACGVYNNPEEFTEEIAKAITDYDKVFAEMIHGIPKLLHQPIETALSTIAWSGMQRPEFDKPIITPFVIPTVLAALFCVCLHSDSWKRAVSRAIGLGGDVDTLGAIVGALMGAKLGLSAVPSSLVEGVVDSSKLQSLALRYFSVVSKNGPQRLARVADLSHAWRASP